MMKAVCPFCGRKFIRTSRGITADQFCHHCLPDRIKASGGKLNEQRLVQNITSNGYVVFAKQE